MISQDSNDPIINKHIGINNLPLTPLSTGPVLPPLSAEIVMLIPRAKTTTEAISKPIPGQFVAFDNNPTPDIRRAYSAPTKSSKLPPYETSELVCYCFFRIFYRITEGAFPKPEIFQPFTNAVHLLLCKSGAGMTCLIVALRYIQRLRMSPNLDKDGIQPKPDNYNYTLFVSSLILAQKWIKDDRFSNSYWARSSGLSIAEINKNERQFLNLIGWNLNVSLEDYGKWRKTMQLLGCEHSALVKKTQTDQLKEGVNINAGHQQMLMQYQQQQMAQQNLQTQQQFLLPRHNSIHNNRSPLYNTAPPRSSSHLHNSNTNQNMDLS